MRIHCTTTFLDGTQRFVKDDIRTVDDADGERFIRAGWAVREGAAAAPAAAADPVTLQVQNASQGQKERKHG